MFVCRAGALIELRLVQKLFSKLCFSALLVLYIMTERPLCAASWWSRHFVCAVSSGELHKAGENVKRENYPYRCPPFYTRTPRLRQGTKEATLDGDEHATVYRD